MVFSTIQIGILLIITVVVLIMILSKIYLRRLKKYDSPLLGSVEVWQRVNGEKILTINKSVQGISIENPSITKSYWYHIAQKALDHCKNRKNPHVLFLGLGANTSSLLISRQDARIHQTIIEIDDAIITACKEFFELDTLENYTLIKGDIHTLITTQKKFAHTFDVIVVDVFSGKPPYVSLETNEMTFVKKIVKWTKKDALLIFNRHADTPTAREIGQKLYKNLVVLSKKTRLEHIKDPRGYENYVITINLD